MVAATSEEEDYTVDFARFYIMTILYEGPQHGYNILVTFKKRTGKEISPSLIYPFLNQLEKRGLVIYSLRPVGAKKKKVFELTPQGREFCRHLFKRFSALVSTAIEPSLTICSHCGCKIYGEGHKENINGVEMAFCCIHCAESYKIDRAEKPKPSKESIGR